MIWNFISTCDQHLMLLLLFCMFDTLFCLFIYIGCFRFDGPTLKRYFVVNGVQWGFTPVADAKFSGIGPFRIGNAHNAQATGGNK